MVQIDLKKYPRELPPTKVKKDINKTNKRINNQSKQYIIMPSVNFHYLTITSGSLRINFAPVIVKTALPLPSGLCLKSNA